MTRKRVKTKDIAALLGVSVQTIYNWRWQDKHPGKQQEYNRAAWRRLKIKRKQQALREGT